MGEISITNGIAIAMRNLYLKILVMARSLRYAEKYLKSTDIWGYLPMDGQDPADIKMGNIDEEESSVVVHGTAILGIDPEAGSALLFKDLEVTNSQVKLSVYLATDGNLNKSIELGELKEDRGTVKMAIPLGTDTSPYNTVVLRDAKSKKKVAVIEL